MAFIQVFQEGSKEFKEVSQLCPKLTKENLGPEPLGFPARNLLYSCRKIIKMAIPSLAKVRNSIVRAE